MKAKRNNTAGGLVYSTDPDFKLTQEKRAPEGPVLPAMQVLKIKLETKHRAGKAVTLIENYMGPDEEKEVLVKKLKAFCGTGGTFKDNEMIIQGDHREKILLWLKKSGFTKSSL